MHITVNDLPQTREESWQWYKYLQDKYLAQGPEQWREIERQLGRQDLFYLMCRLLRRPDMNRDWLFERIREVQAEPDGYLDLWFREAGKALATTTPVLTANRGWTPHGELIPGDLVWSPEGRDVEVMAVTDHFPDSPCYRITFSRHGGEIIAHKNHLWRIRRRIKHRIKGEPHKRCNEFVDEIVTTEWLAQNPAKRRDVGTCAALQMPTIPLPLDPYILGVWLGDGTRGAANITAGIDDAPVMKELLEAAGTTVRTHQRPLAVALAIGSGLVYKRGSSDVRNALRDLGILKTKRIPDIYLHGSVDQRMALLQGLMDTDGTCDRGGTATFAQADEIMARQVYDLAASLGLQPHIAHRIGTYRKASGVINDFWQVSFQGHTDRKPFRMPRKLARLIPPSHYRDVRTISKVEACQSVTTNCIQVEGGMYCVGHELIPTHNSSIITCGLTVMDILRDPEITVGIFSHTRPIAKGFLAVLKREFEDNRYLVELYPDVLWDNPSKQAPKWSEDGGLILKRRSNPKEGTLEAHGLVDGMPTGKHFALRVYDDVVPNVLSPDMVQKTTDAWDLSQNLGMVGGRARYIGTRYSLHDTYAAMMERGAVTPRIHAATHNGRMDGTPVFFSDAEWQKKLRNSSRSIIASQQLQNPMADEDATFRANWLRTYEVRPRTLNVYIMADPSRGRYTHSDATAIAVIGVAAGGVKYLLDGYVHRMSLSQRWQALRTLYHRWSQARGVMHIEVGYERYGSQSDDEYFQEQMRLEVKRGIANANFPIKELNWPREGGNSKRERVERLEPDFRNGRLYLPSPILHNGKPSVWRPIVDPDDKLYGTLHYEDAGGFTSRQMQAISGGSTDLVAKALIQRDPSGGGERGQRYDVTAKFLEQYLSFPFGAHDDLIDAVSRIYDMDADTPITASQRTENVTVYSDGV